jgi:tRNA dimethylallyltransferase
MTVLAIVGPTASGKSSAALQLARHRMAGGDPVEVVAVDAFTVYRGMDLGTAKPSADERAEVRHHLVDVLDPDQELTVAAFQRQARAAVADILARGATPLLVGGSGLYWRAVVDDLRFPPTDAAVRTRLEARWASDHEGAHAALAAQDPDAAATIAPENHRRVVRALEVIELTGERFSAFREAWDRYDSVWPVLRVAYLDPPSEVLRDRIRARAEQMVARGLVAEAEALRARGPLSRTAAQAIGYAEAFAVLDGTAELAALPTAIATRTWRYAKRQRSWFRADPRCQPVDPTDLVASLGAPGSSLGAPGSSLGDPG